MNAKIGQLFLIGLSGPSLTDAERKFILEEDIGGVVLFDRNIETPEQIAALVRDLQSLRSRTESRAPLFIGIDMEGGRIARLREPFTLWPALKHLGETDSPTLSFHFAMAMGRELKAVGINLDFAPCVDVFSNPANTVIGDRSIGTDAELVARHASALVRGYMKAGVIPCAKHYPGHGNTLVDSHEDLPVEQADLARLNEIELKPFARSFRSRVPMIMTAHVSFPNVDPKWPVTLSEIFMRKIARDDMRFRGLIITDDLDMQALSRHYDRDEVPVRSFEAGADLLLYCNEPDSPARALENLKRAVASGRIGAERVAESLRRALEIKNELLTEPDPLSTEEAAKLVGCADHQKIAQAMRSNRVPEGLTAPKD